MSTIVSTVLLAALLATPQTQSTESCEEVCATVLAESLEWTLAQIPNYHWADPDRVVVDLHLRRDLLDADVYAAREAEFEVVRRLARSEDLLAVEEDPVRAACQDRDSEECRDLMGLTQIRVGGVEIVGPTEATVDSRISVFGGGRGRNHLLARRLYLERVDGIWQVARAALLVRT